MNSQLIVAAREGNLNMVRDLLGRGANIHFRNDQALILAAWNGHLNVVRELLNRGADIHAQNDQALILASEHGRGPVVRRLLDGGANIRAQNDKGLRVAAIKNHILVIQLFLTRGPPNYLDILSPELQARYSPLIPEFITVGQYFRIEPNIEGISELVDRYLLYVNQRISILLKNQM